MSNSDLAVTMYESDPVVAALNQVPGFDPLKLVRRKRDPKAADREKELDFRYKKLWFRLAHRQGRIRLNRLSITEQMAVYEAQIFLERTDESPISSFTAACTREEAGGKYIEGAQIKAMDQALTDAGFGLRCRISCSRTAGNRKCGTADGGHTGGKGTDSSYGAQNTPTCRTTSGSTADASAESNGTSVYCPD